MMAEVKIAHLMGHPSLILGSVGRGFIGFGDGSVAPQPSFSSLMCSGKLQS
jgi:hypothetical protein